MKYILTILTIFFYLSCSDDCCPDPEFSYGFDIRQCAADLFANDVSETATIEEREADMHQWLANQDVVIGSVTLSVGFYDAVCEACDVCPMGDRYFIKTYNEFTLEKAEELRLLNFKSE